MAESRPVLVLISEDPRRSHRANEALRIALGIVAGENAVTIVLTGPAVRLLDADTDDLVDGDDIAKYRASLKTLDIPFYVERSAIPPGDLEWNADGAVTVSVSTEEITDLFTHCRRFIVF